MYSWRPWSEPRQAISPGDLVPPQNSVPLGPSPAVVAKMAADVKASLCAYPVTVFPEIAHLSPDAVTASVDSLCGEALTGSPAVGIGGCGQNLLRETARFPASAVQRRPFCGIGEDRSRAPGRAVERISRRLVEASRQARRVSWPTGTTPLTGVLCTERAPVSTPFLLTVAMRTGAACPHGTVRSAQDCIHARTCQCG
jgi:hypothetical protein